MLHWLLIASLGAAVLFLVFKFDSWLGHDDSVDRDLAELRKHEAARAALARQVGS